MVRLALISLALILTASSSLAQWVQNGTGVCTALNSQGETSAAPDGAGGMIVAWSDYRNGATTDIYAQRINAMGEVQWTLDGVVICNAASWQQWSSIVPDGAGGAIVTWSDYRNGSNYDIYAQRINASGVVQWAANGVVVCNAAGSQSTDTSIPDGAGGAIIAWQDGRSGPFDIYAQRINASGVVQWTANGVQLCNAADSQSGARITTDGTGGAIVTWEDYRSGSHYDIYARRISASGVPQWTASGVALCTSPNNQQDPQIASDGAGGAIVTWDDQRALEFDIYAQRVNATGVVQWAANGVQLCGASDDQWQSVIASDGAGGAVVAWRDERLGTLWNIYAQRITGAGAKQWNHEGIRVCTASSDQYAPSIISVGTEGTIVAWEDFRNGTDNDIYAQKISPAGALQWASNGTAVCTAYLASSAPSLIADGSGGAIVAWLDYRTNSADIYAQRIEGRLGYWGRLEPTLDSASDNPGDQGGKVELNWRASGRDVLNQQLITEYSIWRALDEAAALSLASLDRASLVDGPASRREESDERAVIWRDRDAAATYYWEYVGSQMANYSEAYSYLASTRQDSLASNPATHYFRIVSEGFNQYYSWPSNVLSAHSVDNLAPAAPFLLTAQRVGGDVHLEWNRAVAPDLRDYSVYRATASGVSPVPLNFLAGSEDTVLVDKIVPPNALYYIVTAFDVHDNQSAPSNEASVGSLTDIGNTPPITALTVLENAPNPFGTTTTLRVGLPQTSDVAVEVFDVAGRRVRSETMRLAAGWRNLTFEAVTTAGAPLPSGVYFYRVRAAGETITRKMVIAR